MARALLADRLDQISKRPRRIEAQTAGKSWEANLADWVTRDVVERKLSASPKRRATFRLT